MSELYRSCATLWIDYAVQVGIEGFVAACLLWLLWILRSHIPTKVLYGCCIVALLKFCIPTVPIVLPFILADSLPVGLVPMPEPSQPEEPVVQPRPAHRVSPPLAEPVQPKASSPQVLTGPAIRSMPGKPLPVVTPVSEAAPIPWREILFAVVLVGWCVFSAGWVAQILRWSSIRKRTEPADDTLRKRVDDYAGHLGLRSIPEIRIAEDLDTPVVIGFIRTSILIPKTLLDSPEDLELAVLHELIHIKRRDPLLNRLRGLVQILQWWNPLVWWLNRKADVAQERCCDETVLNAYGHKKHRYMELLMRLAEGTWRQKHFAEAVAISNDFRAAKERMQTMLSTKRLPQMNWAWRIGLLLFVVWLYAEFYGQVPSLAQMSTPATEEEPTRLGYCFDAALSANNEILYVVGGSGGTYVLRVSENELKYVRTILAEDGYHRNIKVQGNYAYIADAKKGLIVLDITSPDSPACVFTASWKDGMGLFLTDQYLYLASGEAGIKIIDITDPKVPKAVGEVDTPGSAWDVWVEGNYAYIADLEKGMAVIDVTQPAAPKHIAQATWAPDDSLALIFQKNGWKLDNNMAEIIRGSGNLVHVGAGVHGLVTIDISDPRNPTVKDKFKSGPDGFGEGLAVAGSTVYLANGNNSDESQNGLYVIDASTPDDLKVAGKARFQGWVEGVLQSGDRVYITNTQLGVRMFDVSDPKNPKELAHWHGGRLPGSGPARPEPTPTRPTSADDWFRDSTENAGFLQSGTALSLSLEDNDGDGDLDIYVFGGGADRDALYMNLGKLVFQDTAASSGLPSAKSVVAGAWADANGDGAPDLVLGTPMGGGLYLNDGKGRYQLSPNSGIEPIRGWSAWIDFDCDNALDLVTYGENLQVRLYKNLGNGTFQDVAKSAGIDFLSEGNFCFSGIDYNRDGYADIYSGSGYPYPDDPTIRATLWQNNRDGTLMNLGRDSDISKFNDEVFMPAIGDLNGDGYLDLYAPKCHQASLTLLNEKGERFAHTPFQGDAAPPQYANGVCVGDYNADGRPDLFLTRADGGFLFEGGAELAFTDVNYKAGMHGPGGMSSPVWVDLDGDLDLDLLAIDGAGNLRLFENRAPQGNRLAGVPMTDA
ncbi:MAG TPA: M56 family metallopeptidase, partial [bacterium]|nr:M56 family metallopeptidase [bacterium]